MSTFWKSRWGLSLQCTIPTEIKTESPICNGWWFKHYSNKPADLWHYHLAQRFNYSSFKKTSVQINLAIGHTATTLLVIPCIGACIRLPWALGSLHSSTECLAGKRCTASVAKERKLSIRGTVQHAVICPSLKNWPFSVLLGSGYSSNTRFLGPHKSKSQTSSWSAQPFLHS